MNIFKEWKRVSALCYFNRFSNEGNNKRKMGS